MHTMNNDCLPASTFDFPLHVLNEQAKTMKATPSSSPFPRRMRRPAYEMNSVVRLSLASAALVLLSSSNRPAATTGGTTAATATINCFANALSMSPRTVMGARSAVDQAVLLRRKKFGDAPETSVAMEPPAMDNDDWISTLFGDVDAVDGVGADAGLLEEKRRAEQFDRFMEEDASVASLVKEQVRPVRIAKGADVDHGPLHGGMGMGMEALLKREAERRREASGRLSVGASAAASSTKTPSTNKTKKIMRRSNAAAKLSAPRQPEPKAKISRESSEEDQRLQDKSSSKLLTREEEYRLAQAIQLGTHIHKLKATHESATGQPITKKQWAQLANLSSPNELRRIISSYRSAKQELVSSNMGLVHAVVKTYRRKARAKGISLEELVQEGSLGLIRAAELFDPAKGLRFSTYATIWIKGVLSNYSFDEMIALPNREKTKWNKIQKAIQDLEELGATSSSEEDSPLAKKKAASPAELAEYLGMKPEEVETTIRRMSRARNVLSLDFQYTTSSRSGYAEGNNNLDLLNTYRGTSSSSSNTSADTDADLAERAHLQTDVLSTLLSHLTSREVQLLRLRYGLEDGQERTIKECAEIMGMNRETARKLQHACLEKLREARDVGSLQEYLLTVA